MAQHGKKYLAAAAKINPENLYEPQNAIALVKETSTTKFDATVELHIRLGVDRRSLYGSDGLGGTNFVVAERQHLLPSEKVICDQVRDAPHAVTIVALGPLTNVARALSNSAHPRGSSCQPNSLVWPLSLPTFDWHIRKGMSRSG